MNEAVRKYAKKVAHFKAGLAPRCVAVDLWAGVAGRQSSLCAQYSRRYVSTCIVSAEIADKYLYVLDRIERRELKSANFIVEKAQWVDKPWWIKIDEPKVLEEAGFAVFHRDLGWWSMVAMGEPDWKIGTTMRYVFATRASAERCVYDVGGEVREVAAGAPGARTCL